LSDIWRDGHPAQKSADFERGLVGEFCRKHSPGNSMTRDVDYHCDDAKY
jgi:hypothetical protein